MRDLVQAALDDKGGYYVIAYEPPPGTFPQRQLRYRKLTVHVSRKGLTVRTRGGFYSVEDEAVLLRY